MVDNANVQIIKSFKICLWVKRKKCDISYRWWVDEEGITANKDACLQLWFYLPTPPLEQDMTQGQFLSGV